MNKIKSIVDSCGIEEKRMQRDNNKRKCLALSTVMSDLTRYQSVATYVDTLNQINYDEMLLHKLFYLEQQYSVDDELVFTSEQAKNDYLKKLRRIMRGRQIEEENLNMMYATLLLMEEQRELREQLMILEFDANVLGYKVLREEYNRLMAESQEYYQAINTDFRDALSHIGLPNIFLYQGVLDRSRKLKLSRHIILSDACEAYIETPNIVAYPNYDIRSKRNARKFYNQTSFKYLEQLSQDYDFDIKTKKLGKLEIR